MHVRVWPFTVRGTGALVLAIGCFVAAGELGLPVLLSFGLLMLALPAAGLVSLLVARRAESVERSLAPDVVTVGRAAIVTARVGLRTPVPTAPGTWSDALPKGLAGDASGSFPATSSGLGGRARAVGLAYTVTGARRGIHPIGPLTVVVSDPFGLVRRRIVFAARTPVTVAPAIAELSPVTGALGDAGGTLHTENDQLGQGADNLVARPYLPGDSMRRIHWRASAHRGELMVRQEEQESTPDAVVVLDRGVLRFTPDAMRATGADPGFEAAVTMCVSAVARLVHDGYAVDVVDSDGTPYGDRIDGGDYTEVEALRTAFASITARRDDHLALLPTHFAGLTTGPVVVVTGRLDLQDADALASVVRHSSLPMLFAVAPSPGALDRAADAGWRVGRIAPDADLDVVWTQAVDRGASSGSGRVGRGVAHAAR